MGSTGHVIVVGSRARQLLAGAQRRLAQLEAAWSRFRPDSDVSRLNAAGGLPVQVSRDTLGLVRHAVRAWELTDGHFDPTVHAAMLAHGYDRDLRAVRAGGAPAPAGAEPAPGCAGVEIDATARTVRLPAGVGFDPGGIGKGLAADLVCAELLARGASGALVNVGGDLRTVGRAPGGDGWIVSVPDPFCEGRELLRMTVDDAAVATSSVLGRRWTAGDSQAHHLMDPATGAPLAGPLSAVTVVAASGVWAEAVTKALLVAGNPHAVRRGPAADYVAVGPDGTRLASPAMLPLLENGCDPGSWCTTRRLGDGG